jgi:hypothetical protein
MWKQVGNGAQNVCPDAVSFSFLFRNLVQGGHSSSKQAGSASLFTSSSTSLDITILYFFYFADSLHTVMLG